MSPMRGEGVDFLGLGDPYCVMADESCAAVDDGHQTSGTCALIHELKGRGRVLVAHEVRGLGDKYNLIGGEGGGIVCGRGGGKGGLDGKRYVCILFSLL